MEERSFYYRYCIIIPDKYPKLAQYFETSLKSFDFDIQTFEEGVRKGLYSDDKGTAYLILNGTLFSSYNIYIDRRRITKAGAVVSFEGFLKNYTPDQIQICYETKEPRLPSLSAYREGKKKKKK